MSKLVKVLIAMTTCAFLFVGCGSKEEEAPKNDPAVEQQQETNEEKPEEQVEEKPEEQVEEKPEEQVEEKPEEQAEEKPKEEFVLLDKPGLNKEIEKLNTALREQLQPQYDNEDMNIKLEAANIEMQAWDSLLGQIYQNIQMTKSQEEIATIMEDQVDWVNQRDASIEEETSAIEDELEKSAKRLDILINKTREKCAEVVDKYVFDTAELEEFKKNNESESSEDKNGTGETGTVDNEATTEEGTTEENATEEPTTEEGTTEENATEEPTTEEGTTEENAAEEPTTEEGTTEENTTEEPTE